MNKQTQHTMKLTYTIIYDALRFTGMVIMILINKE